MRKRFGASVLAVLMAAALTVPALADGPDTAGIYLLTEDDSCSLFFYEADGDTTDETDAIAAVDGFDNPFYPNAEKIKVIADASNDAFYLIIAQNSTEVPQEGNIVYVDQSTGAEQTVTFTVYPKSLVSGTTYYIYLSSSAIAVGEDGRQPIASFTYYQPYMLGDVDGDKEIGLVDALMVLRHCAGLELLTPAQEKPADANKDNSVDPVDALMILQHNAGIIDLTQLT